MRILLKKRHNAGDPQKPPAPPISPQTGFCHCVSGERVILRSTFLSAIELADQLRWRKMMHGYGIVLFLNWYCKETGSGSVITYFDQLKQRQKHQKWGASPFQRWKLCLNGNLPKKSTWSPSLEASSKGKHWELKSRLKCRTASTLPPGAPPWTGLSATSCGTRPVTRHRMGKSALPLRSRVLASYRVMDHGPGVPSEALGRLFDAFYRPEAARQRHTGGSGLGPAIAKRCVEACGGTIWRTFANRVDSRSSLSSWQVRPTANNPTCLSGNERGSAGR